MSTLLLIVGFGGLIAGGVLLKIARLTAKLSNIPSSTIANAKGVVQISGLARAAEGARTHDPEGVPCIWHRVIRVYRRKNSEREHLEGDPPADPAAVDTILLDDGTGRCAMVLGKRSSRFMDRQVWKTEGLTQVVILRIPAGTKIYAVGRVEKLARPERGATHRIEWERSLLVGYSDRSLEVMTNDIPWMNKWGIGLLLLGAPALAYGLWLSFGPMFE
jgi:hypothetical protein